MATAKILVVEDDGTITRIQASTSPGSPPGTVGRLIGEVADAIKSHEDGKSELWYSEEKKVNLIDTDRRKV
jgi:hypothetical protein